MPPIRERRVAHALMALSCMLFAAVAAPFWPAPAWAETTVTVQAFYEPLGPYGTWVDDPTYGRVWRPRDAGADWRPYTYGRWAYTSEYGWVWVSEEPWGSVVYHFGQWVWTSQYGWVWVPGDAWAPAWVEWCYSGDYIGWSPMAPDPYWQTGDYASSFDCSAYYSRTVYVRQDRFAGATVSAYVAAPSLNASIAAKAINVTRYSRSTASIVNRSIDVDKLQARTGQTIARLRISRVKSPVAPNAAVTGSQELRIFQPRVVGMTQPTLDTRFQPKLNIDPANGFQLPQAPSAGIDSSTDLRTPGLGVPQTGGIDVGGARPLPDLGASSLGGVRGGGLLGGGRR